MKFGTYTFPLDNLSIEDRLDRLKAVGYDFVGLDYSESFLAAVKHCEKINLPIENVHLECDGTSKIWLDDEAGEEIVKSYCEQIEVCANLGITTGIAHPTYGPGLVPPGEIGLRRYERIVECANKYDFILCVENTRASNHLNYVLDHIQDPKVLFCYDSGHDLGMTYGTKFFNQYLRQYGNRLGAIHIHDSIIGQDMHMAPFDCAIDWDVIAMELAKTEYGTSKLCAEPGGRINAKKPGKTAQDLREAYQDFAIVNDESLVKFYDGYYTVYDGYTFEQLADRFLQGMKKLAGKIEDNML